jgi:hypothetical protein
MISYMGGGEDNKETLRIASAGLATKALSSLSAGHSFDLIVGLSVSQDSDSSRSGRSASTASTEESSEMI